jgi:PPM family protein phosphatase
MNQKAIDYGIICDVGGKGKGNEDSALLNVFDLIIAPGSPKSKLYAHKTILALVADGVSGSAKGEEGSTFAIRCLANKITAYLLTENVELSAIQSKIDQFIKETNQALFLKFKEMIEKESKIPKTTLVGVLVIGQWIWFFNLGDSRGYLIKDNQIHQITTDHIGGNAHEITQAIGEPDVKPAIQVYNWAFVDHDATKKSFQSDYYFVICSDGLTDTVNAQEINQIIMDKTGDETLQSKVEKMYNLTLSRKINDNVSIIAVNLSDYLASLSPIQIIKLSYSTK